MLESKPITLKVEGVNYCPVCDITPVEFVDEICEECRKEGWRWEDVSTDRGIQKILSC